MRGMNSASVDLIYLDPPFNSKKDYAAPIGSKAAGAVFKDSWTWNDVDRVWLAMLRDRNPALHVAVDTARLAHSPGMAAYISMMAQRLEEMKRILKPDGSIYLHCDPIASHYLKILMDIIFDAHNARNEIVWRIGWVSGFKTQKRGWIRNHDTLLYYCSPAAAKKFNKEYLPYPKGYVRRDGKKPTGKGFPIEDTWNCSTGDVLDSIMIKSFSTEKTGYPTQKPLALLRRIIAASSDEGDVVLDPFCGCATTCVAAEELDRQWVGIDISHKAAELVRMRLQQAVDETAGIVPTLPDVIHRTDLLRRTDMGKLPRYTAHKDALYGESGGYCGGCNVHFEKRNLTVDHIVPRSKGGTDHPENLWLLCGACNSSKGTKSQAEFIRDRMSLQGVGVQWLDQ